MTGGTVHILDDGFQHFQLDRDVDIVLVTRDDVADATTIPLGRLLGRHVKGTLRREPPDVLVAADAIVALDDVDLPGLDMPVFRARRTIGRAVFESSPLPPDAVAIGVAGIADPRPFFESLAAGGWRIASTRAFPDHHAYSRSDVDRIFAEGRRAGASVIRTTEKDFVRLLPYRPFPMHVGWLPLTMEAEPRAEFRQWLAASMASARDIVVI